MYDVDVISATTIELETALNDATGRLNLAHAELVAVIVKVLETGCWNGHGIRSPEHWVTWKTGVNPARARDLVLVAKRSLELPVTSEAFNDGLLSVDQVAVISRDTPSEFDETVCTLAKSATVPQLRSLLRKYPWSPCKPTKTSSDNTEPSDNTEAEPAPEPGPAPVDRVTARHDETGRFHLHAELGTLEGAEIEAALNEAKDALYRAGNRNATMVEALLEVCRRSLNAASSASRTDNYRVYLHVDTDHAWINGGPKLPESIRSKILCDANIYPYLMSNGKPINVGRVTRVIPPHTRRAVLDRDSTCRYPGCTTRRLEVHHLVHWEHLGPTNTNNLAGLCSYHHHRHHDGTYTVSGNADIHDGLIFKRADGTTIQTGPQPTQPTGPLRAPPNPYKHPAGEQLQNKYVILSPNRKSVPNPNEQAAA
jgi:Domain of unknown function (DUF222)